MSALHVVFDGYHLQKAFGARIGRPIKGDEVRQIRNAVANWARPSGWSLFKSMRTTFVTGRVGPEIVDRRARFVIDRNVRALATKESKSIDYVLLPLRRHGDCGFRQDESKCDKAIVDRIDAALQGQVLAICTVDGSPMTDGDGRLVPGIADALKRARRKGVDVWLFTFADRRPRPGKELLNGLDAGRHLTCRLHPRGRGAKLEMASGLRNR